MAVLLIIDSVCSTVKDGSMSLQIWSSTAPHMIRARLPRVLLSPASVRQDIEPSVMSKLFFGPPTHQLFLSVGHQKYFNLKRQRLFIDGVIWLRIKEGIAEKARQMQPSLQLRNCSLQPYCCCPSKFDVKKNVREP